MFSVYTLCNIDFRDIFLFSFSSFSSLFFFSSDFISINNLLISSRSLFSASLFLSSFLRSASRSLICSSSLFLSISIHLSSRLLCSLVFSSTAFLSLLRESATFPSMPVIYVNAFSVLSPVFSFLASWLLPLCSAATSPFMAARLSSTIGSPLPCTVLPMLSQSMLWSVLV